MDARNHQRMERAGAAEIVGPDALEFDGLADQDGLHHPRESPEL